MAIYLLFRFSFGGFYCWYQFNRHFLPYVPFHPCQQNLFQTKKRDLFFNTAINLIMIRYGFPFANISKREKASPSKQTKKYYKTGLPFGLFWNCLPEIKWFGHFLNVDKNSTFLVYFKACFWQILANFEILNLNLVIFYKFLKEIWPFNFFGPCNPVMKSKSFSKTYPVKVGLRDHVKTSNGLKENWEGCHFKMKLQSNLCTKTTWGQKICGCCWQVVVVQYRFSKCWSF